MLTYFDSRLLIRNGAVYLVSSPLFSNGNFAYGIFSLRVCTCVLSSGPAEGKNVWGANTNTLQGLSVKQTATTLILENFGGCHGPPGPPVPPTLY